MEDSHHIISLDERNALKQDFFSSLHCSLPGNIVSYNAETYTATIQPAVKVGSMSYPLLYDVPVFMPVSISIEAGDPCLIVFADIDIDAWLSSDTASEPISARRHSLSDGFALVGLKGKNKIGPVSKLGAGLCPALPDEETVTKFLRQDGQWAEDQRVENIVTTKRETAACTYTYQHRAVAFTKCGGCVSVRIDGLIGVPGNTAVVLCNIPSGFSPASGYVNDIWQNGIKIRFDVSSSQVVAYVYNEGGYSDANTDVVLVYPSAI